MKQNDFTEAMRHSAKMFNPNLTEDQTNEQAALRERVEQAAIAVEAEIQARAKQLHDQFMEQNKVEILRQLVKQRKDMESLHVAIASLATISISALHALIDNGQMASALTLLARHNPKLYCKLSGLMVDVWQKVKKEEVKGDGISQDQSTPS